MERVRGETCTFVANDIVWEDKRCAILLNAVGPGMYRLLKILVLSRKVDELKFDMLVKLAKVHSNPKFSLIVKWFESNSRCQQDRKSITMYVMELRKVAEHCENGTVLNDMLQDRLVCEISYKRIQCCLLLEPGLTFKKAIEMALAVEAAKKTLDT